MSSIRRARAAYEFGVLSLCLLQVSPQTEAKLEKALHMLAEAAELGQIEALGIVGWLYEASGKALPASLAETEMELLSEPFFMGTRSTARRRLRHLGWTRPMETSDLGYYPGVIHRVRSMAHSQLPLDVFVTHRITPHSHVRKLLWSAVCNGQDRLLHRLTRNSLPEINLVDKNGDSALLMASRRGNSQAMLQLLNAGADAYLANY